MKNDLWQIVFYENGCNSFTHATCSTSQMTLTCPSLNLGRLWLWQKWHYAPPEVRWQETIQVLPGSLQTLALELSHLVSRRGNRGPRLWSRPSHSWQPGPAWQPGDGSQNGMLSPRKAAPAMPGETGKSWSCQALSKEQIPEQNKWVLFYITKFGAGSNTNRKLINLILSYSFTKCVF